MNKKPLSKLPFEVEIEWCADEGTFREFAWAKDRRSAVKAVAAMMADASQMGEGKKAFIDSILSDFDNNCADAVLIVETDGMMGSIRELLRIAPSEKHKDYLLGVARAELGMESKGFLYSGAYLKGKPVGNVVHESRVDRRYRNFTGTEYVKGVEIFGPVEQSIN